MALQTTYALSPAFTVAIEGALADNSEFQAIAKFNGEASLHIPFGRAVKFGASDNAALLPAAETDKVCGIVMHANQYDSVELTSTGIAPGAMLNILRKGRLWVMARTAVTPGDRLWVRAVSSDTGFEVLGGLEDADDSTDTIDCNGQGVWLTTAAQGALAVLEVDFTNKP